MVEVSTFAGFLTAIAGTEDVVLTADIDAQAERYDILESPVSIQCNLDGQGHSISNVTIASQYGIALGGNKTAKKVNFHNWIVKGTLYQTGLFNSPGRLEECQVSACVDCADTPFRLNSSGSIIFLKNCVIDITVNRATGWVTNYMNTEFSSLVIRGGDFSSSGNHNVGYCDYGTLIFYQCIMGGIFTLSGRSSCFAFEDCTGSAIASGNSATSSLFACSGDIFCTVSGLTEITPEQAKNESYLREIGFLP